MDIVIARGGLQYATSSEYRNKAVLLDVTHAVPQASVHMRDGSADQDGSAASTSEARKHNNYARVGQVPFDERSHKLVTLAKALDASEKEDSELFDQSAASIVGGTDGGSLCRNVFVRNIFSRQYR